MNPFNQMESHLDKVNPLHFYKYNNLPIKGLGTNLIPADAAPHEDLQLVSEPHLLVTRLWVPEDLELYNEVMSRIGKGWSALRYEEKQWVESKENWMILLGYMDFNWTPPTAGPILQNNESLTPKGNKVYGKVNRKSKK